MMFCSRKLTSVISGISHTQKIAGGVATRNPSFTQGVPWRGAESDSGKNGDLPKAQFRKWSLNGSFQRPLATPGELSGFIVCAKSPSCGMERVRLYDVKRQSRA